jgi:uncharacterized iron-regulated protein
MSKFPVVTKWLALCLVSSCAHQLRAESVSAGWFSGSTLQPAQLEDFLAPIRAGDVVLLGETHNESAVAQLHLEILKRLRTKIGLVHVGMEFLDWTQQSLVEDYRQGKTPEEEFLKQIQWGGFDFAHYREQILFPNGQAGEALLAINAPRTLTRAIARSGLESLSDAQKAMLPPEFELGRESYYRRFVEAIGHGGSEESLRRFFAAQSVWDDTMAYQTLKFFQGPKRQGVFVIIVGEFHVQFGGGLPDRLKKRDPSLRIWTLSQLPVAHTKPEELLPSSDEGPRADYIWLF